MTGLNRELDIHHYISTHTPLAGRDTLCTPHWARLENLYFYSHAREGRDADRRLQLSDHYDFYSHAREGRDTAPFPIFSSKGIFLLTRPRGA